MGQLRKKGRRKSYHPRKNTMSASVKVILAHIRGFFAPPVFPDDEEKTRQAKVLNALLVNAILVMVFIACIAIPFIFKEKLFNTLMTLVIIITLGVEYWLMRRGRVRNASVMVVVCNWLIFTIFLSFAGGMNSAVVVFYLLGAVITGLLLGKRDTLLYVVACCLVGLGMVLLEAGGRPLPRIFPVAPIVGWVDMTVALILTALFMNLTLRDLREALALAYQRLEERKRAEEDTSLQVDRLRALNNIEQAILSSMDLDMLLRLLVREVAKQLHVDAVDVLLYDPQKQTLDFVSGEGFHTKALRYTSLMIGAGLAGRAAGEQKVVHIPNLAEMQDNPSLSKAISREKFVSYFGVPLMAKDQLHGVLEIFHRSALAPDPSWLSFLETMAGQAAISIDNARLLERTQESLKETNALYRVSQRLVASIDLLQLMKDVVTLLRKNFGYHYVQIFVREPETGDFVVRAGSGRIGKKLVSQGYRLVAGEGIIGYTAETGAPFITNNVDEVIFFKRNPLLPDTKSELAVPIKIGRQFLGLLDVHQALPSVLSWRDVQLVSAVADQLAVALQKAQLYTDLQNSLRQENETRAQLIHSEKLAVAGRLLASVSHELNNPLQAIQNALFLLKEEKGISLQGRQDLNIVLSEAERMTTLLDRLRTTYQPVRVEDFHPVQINDIISDVHTLVATHLRHANISFEAHIDSALPYVSGITDQLRQVFLNLFMNAVDAMGGGGQLTVSTNFLAETNEVLTSVSDTGSGLDPTILEHIFEPFTSNKEKGTGLGLTISYEIIINHGGRIQAENVSGSGAIFRVWLPASKGGGK